MASCQTTADIGRVALNLPMIVASWCSGKRRVSVMRYPWSSPSREEVTAVTTDLIFRHGLFAHGEAVHLSARFLGSSKNGRLYRLAADEIQHSFETAWETIRRRRSGRTLEYLSRLNDQSAAISIRHFESTKQSGGDDREIADSNCSFDS
jgi:hypothetical protein